MYVLNVMMYYDDEFLKTHPLVNVNDNESMKANACMLLRVMCEWCIGLCYNDDLKMNIIGTSCILCRHIYRDTSSFMMMSMNAYTIMMMVMPRMTLRGLMTFGCRYEKLARL